jgi:hypothetical protein
MQVRGYDPVFWVGLLIKVVGSRDWREQLQAECKPNCVHLRPTAGQVRACMHRGEKRVESENNTPLLSLLRQAIPLEACFPNGLRRAMN